jgi:hypothetical protein
MNDTLRALRLYASPVFFRENPTLISAAVYLAITGFSLAHPSRTHPAGIHDIGLFWWLAQRGCSPACAASAGVRCARRWRPCIRA